MTNPVPTEEALSEFYRSHYRAYYRKVRIPTPEHIRAYGLEQRATHTAGYLQGAGLLQGISSVLDVGCAEGSLLHAIGQRAPALSLSGMEPNPEFAEYARRTSQAQIFPSLEAFESLGLRVDLITVNHVLEHVRQPSPFLRRLAGLLTGAGRIYVDVPDVTRYRNIDDLHIAHLYHFSKVSLRNTGSVAGLVCERSEAHEPYRHPFSIRAVFAPAVVSREVEVDSDTALAKRRIIRVARLAPLQRFRRTPVGAAVMRIPAAGLRYVRKLAASR